MGLDGYARIPRRLYYAGRDCFAGQTFVKTPFGEKPIHEIKIGDVVSSWNPAVQTNVDAKITGKAHHAPSTVYALTLEGSGDPLLVSKRHPLLTTEGWKQARNLTGRQLYVLAKNGAPGVRTVESFEKDDQKHDLFHLYTNKPECNYIVSCPDGADGAVGVIASEFVHFRALRTPATALARRVGGALANAAHHVMPSPG